LEVELRDAGRLLVREVAPRVDSCGSPTRADLFGTGEANGPFVAATAGMLDNEPECGTILTQIEESLRTIKFHIIKYRLRLLRLSLGKHGEITDILENHEEK